MNNPTTISVTRDKSKILGVNYMLTDSFEIPWDAPIEDWIEVFKTILYAQGFHTNTINEAFGDEE